jgi:predicted O-methyltransferase YrrM
MKKYLLKLLVAFFKRNTNLRLKALYLLKIAQSKPNDLVILDYPVNPDPRYGYSLPKHAKLNEIVNGINIIKAIECFEKESEAIKDIPDITNDPIQPCWNNRYFSGLDAIALYSFLNLFKPKAYIEIGSGYSTRFAKKSILDHKLSTKITSIDPMPRAEVEQLCDCIIRSPLEKVKTDIFKDAEPGDIVFMDGSHRVFQNSDTTVFFLEILPVLKPGVIVHIHDIFLPYDYPLEWKERYYSEQYLLATLLLNRKNGYEVLSPNYLISKDEDKLALFKQKHMQKIIKANMLNSSFWLKK